MREERPVSFLCLSFVQLRERQRENEEGNGEKREIERDRETERETRNMAPRRETE